MMTLEDCQALDHNDALRALREQFDLPVGVIYLDGNSLGALPSRTAARVQEVVKSEWGCGLIESWNKAGWFDLPNRIGDKIGQLIGARSGEVVATDSTSINLYKVLHAAMSMCRDKASTQRVVLSERSNFPTDLYIAQSLCQQLGFDLVLVEAQEIDTRLAVGDVGILMLTHVNYRTGAMHDMKHVSDAAHRAGAYTVWDLAHSAGAVPVDVHGDGADYAVGCGYKYLNGGPGAPAFVWVHPDHASRFWQPLSGWWGHAHPFQFETAYQPAPNTQRYLCGTQPMLSLAALECGVDSLLAAGPQAMQALREKSIQLTDLFIHLVKHHCTELGVAVVTPQEPAQRGSQVSLTHTAASPSDVPSAYAIVQALIARGVIGDYRAGDPQAPAHSSAAQNLMRFGFTPAYIGFVDVWHAVAHLREVLVKEAWKHSNFMQRHAVT